MCAQPWFAAEAVRARTLTSCRWPMSRLAAVADERLIPPGGGTLQQRVGHVTAPNSTRIRGSRQELPRSGPSNFACDAAPNCRQSTAHSRFVSAVEEEVPDCRRGV
jgi:hypothetical protein